MNKDNSKWTPGNVIRLIGWTVVLFNAIKYSYYTIDTLSDPSVSAYALLVVFEGAFYVLCGFILVWVGRRMRRKEQQTPIAAENPEQRTVE